MYTQGYMRGLRRRLLWLSAPMAICLLVLLILPLRLWLRDPSNLANRFLFGTMEPIALSIFLAILVALRKGRQWYRELKLESTSDALAITYPRLAGPVVTKRVRWARVYWSSNMLLVGNVLVTLTDWQVGDHFEREPFESWVLSRIPPRNRLGHFGFIRRAIANGNPEWAIWLAAVVGGFIWAAVDQLLKG